MSHNVVSILKQRASINALKVVADIFTLYLSGDTFIDSILLTVFFSLYIHGGRDLKEGAMCSLWRVNLTKVHMMDEDPYLTVEWEPIKTTGQDIGKISHHSAIVVGPMKVLFYGGLIGEDSNDKVYILDLNKHVWSVIPLKVRNFFL